jgi:undecaprenol kinase
MKNYAGKASKVKHTNFLQKHLYSQKFAWLGLHSIFKEEPNFRIELIAAFTVIILGIVLAVSSLEFLVLLLTIGMVLLAEIVNSVAERICDIYTSEHHVGIKFIKDVAAGGVLLTSIISLVIAASVFLPKLYELLF